MTSLTSLISNLNIYFQINGIAIIGAVPCSRSYQIMHDEARLSRAQSFPRHYAPLFSYSIGKQEIGESLPLPLKEFSPLHSYFRIYCLCAKNAWVTCQNNTPNLKLAAQTNNIGPKGVNQNNYKQIIAKLTLEEDQEQLTQADYTKESEVKDMFGCNRDHSKEIDIYNKSFDEKMERIAHLKQEGTTAFKLSHFDKASYYYAQALLIFYYLIPDTPQQEQAVVTAKRILHRNQAVTYQKLHRMTEALQQINLALSVVRDVRAQPVDGIDGKSMLRKVGILKEMGEYEQAEAGARELMEIVKNGEGVVVIEVEDVGEFKGQVQQAVVEVQHARRMYEQKSKEVCGKMLKSKREQEGDAQSIDEAKDAQREEITEIAKAEKTPEDKSPIEETKNEINELIGITQQLQPAQHDVEQRLKKLESKVEDLSMAVELFKAYGFQPKQFDQYMQGLKETMSKHSLTTSDQIKSAQKLETKAPQPQQEVKAEPRIEKRVYVESPGLKPLEKLQFLLLVMFVTVLTSVTVNQVTNMLMK